MKDKLKDKMKKKFTDLSISHKMLMVYITFASAFLLIALGLTQISFRIYSKELYDKSLQELDYFSQNVNRGLKDAERNNYSISMDALVQRTLSDLSVLEYPSLDYNQKIRDLRRILLNEYDPESCVKSIIFVDLYGNTVEVGTAAWDVSGESFTAIKKQMEQGKGAYTTYGPTEECPYLLSGRVVRNRLDMSLSDMGKLIFVCDVGNVISENKESLSSNKAAIYVYNKNCAIYEDENIKKLDDLPKYVEHSGYKILKQSGRKYFVSYLYSAKTDWTYVSFFPYSDIYGQVQTVRTLLILGFLAVFTALVFFMKKLSVVIVSPLEHLTDSMQIVENGDFQGAREMLTNTDRQDEIVGVIGCVMVSLFAAYAFTRIKFKGSNFWFSCVMITMMIPSQVMVVPQYIVLKKLNLIDTRIALILPWFFGAAFFIFMLVQFFRGVPKELDEAAEIDGCGRIAILFRILAPVVKPSIITASIFAFYWIWQDFFQPLIFMSTTSKFTLSLALNMFLDPSTYNNYGGLFAMSVLSLLPTIIFFIIFQRYLVDGIAMDGIKG